MTDRFSVALGAGVLFALIEILLVLFLDIRVAVVVLAFGTGFVISLAESRADSLVEIALKENSLQKARIEALESELARMKRDIRTT